MDLHWILESLPVGLWLGRVPSGEVVYANPEFRRILGMDAREGVPIGEAPKTYGIFTPDGHPYPVEQLPFSRVVATGGPVTVDDIVIHRPDGRAVNIRAFGYPAFDAAGSLAHVGVAFLDVTAEVKAVVDRDRMEARLALAVNNAPIVIWTMNLEGVVMLSEGAGLAALGVVSGQLVGKNIFELYKDHPEIPRYIRRGLAGESFWYTVQVGEAVFDTWMTPTRDAGGAVNGVAALSNDVSQVRKLQAAAIQNDRAIALGTLAASVSHEINNPLTYMLGHLDILAKEIGRLEAGAPPREVVARMREAIEPTRKGTERIVSITRELGTFSRPTTDDNARVDVRAAVETVLKLVRKELEARAQLELGLGETAPVRGNTSRLVQVVLNLVVNALQALPEGPRDLHRIRVNTRNEGESVVIEVADSGPGVPIQDRERIFEPFVTTKDVGQGSGLGLFVCRNIVRGFRGAVTVGDAPGGGALFRVVLPADRDSGFAGLAGAVSTSAPAPARVLIIDDEPLVADLLRMRLQVAGHRAIVEQDPARAVELLVSDGAGIDLVYCDLMMQGMTGMDVAEALAVRAPDQLAKVVFMTGGAFTPRARAFQESRPGQILQKPFDIVVETGRRLAQPPL